MKKERIEHLTNALSKVKEAWEMNAKEDKNQAEERTETTEIFYILSMMTESLDNAIAHLETKSGKNYS